MFMLYLLFGFPSEVIVEHVVLFYFFFFLNISSAFEVVKTSNDNAMFSLQIEI